MNFASIVRQMRVGNCQVLQSESTSALLANSIWRPFRARRSGGRFRGLKPWAEFRSPFRAGSSGRRMTGAKQMQTLGHAFLVTDWKRPNFFGRVMLNTYLGRR
jgi:hypothetical protein